MNSKSIALLLSMLLIVIVSSNLLIRFNTRKADYSPPPPDFEQNRLDFESLITKAEVAIKEENYNRAYELYSAALNFYPKNQGILGKMGELKLQTKSFLEAEKIFTELGNLSPDNPLYKTTLAYIYVNLNKFSQSKEMITQAKKMKFNDPRIFLIEGALAAQEKQTEKALTFLSNFPNHNLLLSFLEEPMFDPIRQEQAFKKFKQNLLDSTKKVTP